VTEITLRANWSRRGVLFE